LTLNVQDQYKNLTVPEIQEIARSKTKPFAVAILNVTGELNTSTIVRTAHNFGCELVLIIGRRRFDNRGLVGCGNYSNISRIEAVDDDGNIDEEIFIRAMKENNLVPFFMETNGIDIREADWYHAKPCLIFGNEGRGIPENILATRDKFKNSQIIEIPMAGVMRSHNVATSAAIAMWNLCDSLKWI